MLACATLAAASLLAAGPASDRPLADLPYLPGLDPSYLDRRADPCVDFFRFACGGWLAANPIPPDQAAWSFDAKLADDARRFLWGLLDDAGRAPAAERTPEEAKVGDYFAACMDEAAVEKAGARPLAADLAAIAALRDKKGLAGLLGRLHATSGAAFGFGSQQSFESSDQVVAVVQAGGLGMPDRDLYLADDAASRETRRAYRAHVERTFRLLGQGQAAAAASAEAVMRLETALARASLSRAERREPRKVWHWTARRDLARLTPAFRWGDYLRAARAPALEWLNVEEPALLRAADDLIRSEPLGAWKAYLRWHSALALSPYLSRPFQEESFAFYGAFLSGVKQQKPRWKRCVAWTDRDLGEALGKMFVARAFPPRLRQEVEEMVRRVQGAMRERIDGLEWMGAATRRAALAKLEAMRNKIGYPDRWRDYSALEVRRGDFAGNAARAARFELARQLGKIGKPVDRGEWQMTPPTVNAYYDPSMNDMNFPAGVLLPPFYDPRLDAAPNYGNAGSTVGHELSHGFDDEGRQFDAAGNLKDWWSQADASEFERRARCIAEQYAQYPVVDDLKINSKLTLGEDIADLGGATLAYAAWKEATRGQDLPARDGFTPEQRFFLGYATDWCSDTRPEELRKRALTDPHSPARWRVNGVLANLPEFARAFGCRAGQPMARESACRVW